jgi:hypothetical protein
LNQVARETNFRRLKAEGKGNMEEVLKSEKIAVERKSFFFDLKENPRGRFLRITEDVNGRRDTIIIPAPGLEDFRKALDAMIEAHQAQS